jgi:hypothetical protein
LWQPGYQKSREMFCYWSFPSETENWVGTAASYISLSFPHTAFILHLQSNKEVFQTIMQRKILLKSIRQKSDFPIPYYFELLHFIFYICDMHTVINTITQFSYWLIQELDGPSPAVSTLGMRSRKLSNVRKGQ